ncbi:hypothetical protein [Streptomyces sp. Amel2xC10]|uniref:hypothetical protein n=1 Tax=Streptomyces sp. Amel2xC10 TaxID=1305826 RepID=UPI000A0871BD|nr:hypothetical protein [Streptomyces sp. Amel2xC10]SMF83286.1 hypothetical protein SAMN02745830_06655 [Streptomyces sp. Amel2xC10]
MPATLDVPQAASIIALVEDLSGWERTVALYASDMPTAYGPKIAGDAELLGWIGQGVARLGRDEVRQRASYLAGYRRVWLCDLVTREIARRHSRRFPSVRRLNMAESRASASVLYLVKQTPAARDLPFAIDGPCPKCDDAGKIWANWVIDDASDWCEEGFGPCWLCQSEGGAA